MWCLTGQYHSAKKRLVQLAVLSGWHYQKQSKFFLNFFLKNCLKLSKKSSCSIFFVITHYSHPNPPPPPLDTEIEVQLNFYPWSKFYFLLFQTHYHSLPYPNNFHTSLLLLISLQSTSAGGECLTNKQVFKVQTLLMKRS